MKSKKKLYWVIGLSLAVSGLGGYLYLKKNGKPDVTYKEHTVAKDDFEISVQATGSVQPENRLVVKPQIAGRVDEVLVQEGKTVKAGQILGWMSSNDRAALVDMARSQSPEEVKRWQEIYKPTPIIAPVGGILIAKQVERGQTVGTGDTVFVISDRLIVLAQVDETDLGKISLGQPVEIRVDAYSDQPVTGKVIRIAYESKQVNNVTIYEIRILPDTVPEFMRSGMTTSVKFTQDKKSNVLVIPVSFIDRAPKEGPKGDQKPDQKPDQKTEQDTSSKPLKAGDKVKVLVKAVDPSLAPESKDVTIGANNGKFAEVTAGLNEGDVILKPEQNAEADKKSANPFSPFGPPKSSRKK